MECKRTHIKERASFCDNRDDFILMAQEYVDKFKYGSNPIIKIQIFREMMYFLYVVQYNWTDHTRLTSVILNKIRMIKNYLPRVEGILIVKELLKYYIARIDTPCISITNTGHQCSRIPRQQPIRGNILKHMCTQHRNLCTTKTRRICQIFYDKLPLEIIHLIINVYCELNICSIDVLLD